MEAHTSSVGIRGGWATCDGSTDWTSPRAAQHSNPIDVGFPSDAVGVARRRASAVSPMAVAVNALHLRLTNERTGNVLKWMFEIDNVSKLRL